MSALDLERVDVVAGLILRQERLLACQRHENSAFPLKWEFPGGKVEQGEAPMEALERELKEELGIQVQRSTEIFSHTHVYPGTKEVNLRFFRIDEYEGEITNLVFQQISWVPVKELSQLDFLEGDLPFIRKLLGREGPKWLAFRGDQAAAQDKSKDTMTR